MAKNQTFTTPAGTARWTCINKPSTKFNPAGEYSLDLALTPEVAGPLAATLKAAAEQAKKDFVAKDAKVKAYGLHVPGTAETDKEGNETGLTLFKFKQIAVITPKDKSKEPFEVSINKFDAKGKALDPTIIIGSGSKLKVAYEIVPFAMAATKKVGVKLRLKAVQVLELVKYRGGVNADSYGFGEEDGYTGTDAPAAEATGTEGEQPAGNGDF